VTISTRSTPSPAHVHVAPSWTRTLLAAIAASLTLTLLLIAAPARADVTEVETGTRVGIQPRTSALVAPEDPETFTNEEGNIVLNGNTSEYAIYWDPKVAFTHEWVTNLDGFFHSLGEAGLDTPFGVIAQYRDRSNAIMPFHALFKGSYSDTVKFPTGECTDPNEPANLCLTDTQLRTQLESFVATHGLPKGMGTIYYLLTPPGVTVCLDKAATHCSDYSVSTHEAEHKERASTSYKDSFCSYHGDINPDNASEGDSSTILYAAIPWTAYTNAYDCQDGGWNPERHEETKEIAKELSTKEKAELAEDTLQERTAIEEELALEGPHIQEPNQEGAGESGTYTAGLSDVLVNQISEEEINTVTDPLLRSWQNSKGEEATDLCRDVFDSTSGENGSGGEIIGKVTANGKTKAGTLSNVSVGEGRYYINNVFSRSEGRCSGGLGLIPRFTSPNPVNTGETITVDGMESTVSLFDTLAFGPIGPPTLTYATFSWNFGDGTPEVQGYAPGAPTCEAPWLSPCAASALHTYQYGGEYNVTLTVTDVDGDKSAISHEITVDGPAPPSASGTSSSGGSGAQSSAPASGSTGATTPSTVATPAIVAPVAAAVIVKQSLKTALRKGLVVSYSVNEQVAGHFEVLITRALARKLGITGTPAVGMPAGSPAELVIAKAILVTTKGGKGAVDVKFSKRTAARLARSHKVPLTLRLVVRNAASSSPATTTVISSASLDS
jgi:PKD domain